MKIPTSFGFDFREEELNLFIFPYYYELFTRSPKWNIL